MCVCKRRCAYCARCLIIWHRHYWKLMFQTNLELVNSCLFLSHFHSLSMCFSIFSCSFLPRLHCVVCFKTHIRKYLEAFHMGFARIGVEVAYHIIWYYINDYLMKIHSILPQTVWTIPNWHVMNMIWFDTGKGFETHMHRIEVEQRSEWETFICSYREEERGWGSGGSFNTIARFTYICKMMELDLWYSGIEFSPLFYIT